MDYIGDLTQPEARCGRPSPAVGRRVSDTGTRVDGRGRATTEWTGRATRKIWG